MRRRASDILAEQEHAIYMRRLKYARKMKRKVTYTPEQIIKREVKNKRYMRIYGITLEEYEYNVYMQENKCAICEKKRELIVDHDHTTGNVRGFICKQCNTGLGLLGDSSQSIAKVLAYLTRRVKS